MSHKTSTVSLFTKCPHCDQSFELTHPLIHSTDSAELSDQSENFETNTSPKLVDRIYQLFKKHQSSLERSELPTDFMNHLNDYVKSYHHINSIELDTNDDYIVQLDINP